MSGSENEITRLLKQWSGGEKTAFEQLLPFVYKELRKRASGHLRNERKGHTLQTTALINEAFINLVGKEIDWESRSHFFAIASKAMRRILVDHARSKSRQKRGGDAKPVSLEDATIAFNERDTDLVSLDEALERLQALDERLASVVELKFFGGFSNDETAKILGVSAITVRRDWKVAKAWLHAELTG